MDRAWRLGSIGLQELGVTKVTELLIPCDER